MSLIVVTGATGTLGRLLVPELILAGHQVRAMTRRQGKVSHRGATEVVADVLDEASLVAAVQGADTIVHLASNPGRKAARTEIDGTRKLLTARDPGTALIYLSIVGCDRTPFAYYRAKTAAEALVRAAPDATVIRATQFHSLVRLLLAPRLGGRAIAPAGLRLQPVDPEYVAQVLVDAVRDPSAAPTEVGGPEQLDIAELARRHTGHAPLPLPLPIPLVQAVRRGTLLAGPSALTGGAPF